MKDLRLLRDMLAAIEAIQSFGIADYDSFAADKKTQDAVMYNLIILGEAANQITEAVQEKHNGIPWSSIIGTRNVIIHGYDQVRLQVVWGIIRDDLHSLKVQLQKALANH